MDELLNNFLLVSTQATEGSTEHLPVDVINGVILPFVFILQIYAVLLCRVGISHVLSDVTRDKCIIDLKCGRSRWWVICRRKV